MMTRFLLVLVMVFVATSIAIAQKNLLGNADSRGMASQWKATGDAEIQSISGVDVFAVRRGGAFSQDVKLPRGSDGRFVLLIGYAAAERINYDGSITDLPYLYGYMMNGSGGDGRINTYLQGQNMLLRSKTKNEWSVVHGIFKVEKGSEVVRFFLNQARRRGDPHDGSEARFSKLGLFLFDSESDASTFVQSY